MPDLRQLRALKAVADTGSFSRAADVLDYTQGAVSKTIAGLEGELGAVLVERDCRPVRLTDAGAALVRHADEVFAHLSSARAEIQAITQAEGGSLGIGCFGSAASAFVVQTVCEFRRAHPGVAVSLVEGGPAGLVRRLRAGELDLAAVWDYPGEDVAAGLAVEPLLEQPHDIVVPAGHRLAAAERIDPAELADEEWILPDLGARNPMMRHLGAMFDAAGVVPRIGFRVNDCKMTLAMVAAGGGVAVLPRLMIEPLPRDVVARPVAGRVPVQRVAAVRLPTRYVTPAAERFLSMLREAAGRLEASWATSAR